MPQIHSLNPKNLIFQEMSLNEALVKSRIQKIFDHLSNVSDAVEVNFTIF